ncbi:MAG: ParB/RepB/Spo0J family partition protein [Polyangiaceae bacterium]|nr:ParB/RepB/Spo0J family partition protein [Polyangiaceae bacterium]MCB9606069.1 ParB/RepB/Spo0J family partition protein [Polyangiaceae bacterium]
MTTKRPTRGLGRGLDALLPTKPPVRTETAAPGAPPPASYGDNNVFKCPIDKLIPQKGQPRQHINQAALEELAQSIREHGLIEPLVARRLQNSDKLELIAGERRWRASQLAGLREVLVVVREVSAASAFELALIENIQRADLDPIEFAEALDRLLKEHSYTQETLATRVGKDRSTIANALRLLKLPSHVRSMVINGELSEGHGRALLGAPDELTMTHLADKAARGRLSVRQTEQLVRAAKQKAADKKPGAKGKTASVRDLEMRLTRRLGTKCEVSDREGKGEVKIKYASLDELDRLLEILL